MTSGCTINVPPPCTDGDPTSHDYILISAEQLNSIHTCRLCSIYLYYGFDHPLIYASSIEALNDSIKVMQVMSI